MPADPTARISSGIRTKSSGEAGEARSNTTASGPVIGSGWQTSCSTKLEAGVTVERGEVLPPPGHEVVDGDHLVAPRHERLAERAADEPGAAGHDDAGHQGRPMPRYVKPSRLKEARSRRLRASTTRGLAITDATLSKSSQRNSSHSVSTASTSAPSHAA